jgi:hypothetical protein
MSCQTTTTTTTTVTSQTSTSTSTSTSSSFSSSTSSSSSTSEMLSTQSIALINASQLFNQNNTGTELNNILTTYIGDLSACLTNCTNQGVCVLNSLTQYVCQCNQYRTGLACQSDSRPCSSNPCLNNGTCSNINDNQTSSSSSWRCICQDNLYDGTYCENKVDLCLNNTDVCLNEQQGYCIMNGSEPMCKCKNGYSGIKCEIASTSLIVRKIIINVSTIIAIVVMISFIILVLFFDFTKYFLMKKKQKVVKKKSKIEKLFYHP